MEIDSAVRRYDPKEKKIFRMESRVSKDPASDAKHNEKVLAAWDNINSILNEVHL